MNFSHDRKGIRTDEGLPAPRLRGQEAGMTLIELVVVLSIFAVLASVIIFNYQKFLSKVNIKVLANDMALKLVEAQKNATSGKQNAAASSSWRPSYGVYFNLASGGNTSSKIFYSFADLNQNKAFDPGSYNCPAGECVERVNITKNDFVSGMRVVYTDNSATAVNSLSISFTRPDASATMRSSTALGSNISYAEITVASPDAAIKALVKVYASGRIQIN